jgi:hypothetical protein
MAGFKDEYIEVFSTFIKRAGADKLLSYLQNTDFFTAPASTKFHLAREGGLVEHTLNVYKRLLGLVKQEYGEKWAETISPESVAVCALLHDICKADTYKIEYRNNKLPDGTWEKKPYYTVEDDLPYGHGEKSVYIINGFFRLTREEAMAINWHMGGFDDRVRGGSFAVSTAFGKYPLAVLLHTADFLATYLDEKLDRG